MAAARSLRSQLPFAFACAVLLALSIPGVEIARAQDDLAPSADELFSLKRSARASPLQPDASSSSCAAPDPAVQQAQIAAQRERIRQLAELVKASGDGEAVVLNGRGYGYQAGPDMAAELQRVYTEAARHQAQQQR